MNCPTSIVSFVGIALRASYINLVLELFDPNCCKVFPCSGFSMFKPATKKKKIPQTLTHMQPTQQPPPPISPPKSANHHTLSTLCQLPSLPTRLLVKILLNKCHFCSPVANCCYCQDARLLHLWLGVKTALSFICDHS